MANGGNNGEEIMKANEIEENENIKMAKEANQSKISAKNRNENNMKIMKASENM
jgi:hypothetical protein